MNLLNLFRLGAVLSGAGLVHSAAGQDRVAFVIGQSDYQSFSDLDNPKQDEPEMTRALERFGFRVVRGQNITIAALKTALQKFAADHAGAKEVVFYFSGHGLQIHGINYLTGTDSALDVREKEKKLAEVFEGEALVRQKEVLLREEAKKALWSLDEVTAELKKIGGNDAVRLVILDSCRDNPLGTKGSLGAKGLAVPAPPSGMLIAFAAQEGSTAAQTEEGQLSLYTRELLKVMARPGLEAEQVFKQTRTAVKLASGDKQIPAEYSLLESSLVFVKGAAAALPAAGPASATRDRPWVNSLGMEFIPIPGMPGRLMCRTETRVADFRAYAAATRYRQTAGMYVLKVQANDKGGHSTEWELDRAASWENPGFAQGEDHPVTGVSLIEARAFTDWLSEKENLTHRLPLDAEWSAAIGAGKYPWGSAESAPKGAGNYFGTEAAALLPGKGWPTAYPYDDGYARTSPAGSFSESRHGFYDLGGNVGEWCADEYKKTMNTAEVLKAYPALEEEKSDDGTIYHVLRGGSWYDIAPVPLRSSYRYNGHPSARFGNFGFRVVVVAGGGG